MVSQKTSYVTRILFLIVLVYFAKFTPGSWAIYSSEMSIRCMIRVQTGLALLTLLDLRPRPAQIYSSDGQFIPLYPTTLSFVFRYHARPDPSSCVFLLSAHLDYSPDSVVRY